MATTKNVWPEEREAELRRLYSYLEGGKYYLSHGLIAINMGLNRAAVIGKIHRLKLTRDPLIPYLTHQGVVIDPKVTSFKPRSHPERPPTVKVDNAMVSVHKFNGERHSKLPQKLSGPGEYMGEVTITACQVTELTSRTCHFPIGHVGKEGFHFCGARVERGSYCGYHGAICLRVL